MNWERSTSRLIGAALIVVLSTTIGGCGFVFVHGPPAGHEMTESFSCTQSNAGPLADVLMAGLGGAMVVWAANQGHYGSSYYYVSDDLAVLGVAAAVFYASSAVVGFLKTKNCRAAKRALAERQRLTTPAPEAELAPDSSHATNPPKIE